MSPIENRPKIFEHLNSYLFNVPLAIVENERIFNESVAFRLYGRYASRFRMATILIRDNGTREWKRPRVKK